MEEFYKKQSRPTCPGETTGAAILAVLATICDTVVPGARLSRLPAADTGMVMYLVVTPGLEVAARLPPACVVVTVLRTVVPC